jgi:DNA invertase Pin-like site-specific DNA recombinase
MASTSLRAAIYCRTSTAKPKSSIARQMANIRPYAERQGYVLSDELTYTDEGSADELAQRPGLQRLLADAAAGRFDVVVVDEVSRLSRQTLTEFVATVAHPLDEAGVRLDTVAGGPVGWDEIGDVFTQTVS